MPKFGGGAPASAAASIPPMPADWQPDLSPTAQKIWPNGMREHERRSMWLRENGYTGWIDQDSKPADDPTMGGGAACPAG